MMYVVCMTLLFVFFFTDSAFSHASDAARSSDGVRLGFDFSSSSSAASSSSSSSLSCSSSRSSSDSIDEDDDDDDDDVFVAFFHFSASNDDDGLSDEPSSSTMLDDDDACERSTASSTAVMREPIAVTAAVSWRNDCIITFCCRRTRGSLSSVGMSYEDDDLAIMGVVAVTGYSSFSRCYMQHSNKQPYTMNISESSW